MKNLKLKFACVLLACMATPAFAGAQGSLTVSWRAAGTDGFAALPVPAMGTGALIAMAVLLGVVGLRLIKSHARATRLMSTVLVAGCLLFSAEAARTGLIALIPNISGEECEAGTRTYPFDQKPQLVNGCSNAVEIIEYAPAPSAEECFEFVDSCPVGTVLEAGGDSCILSHYEPLLICVG
jgi:hypothetical protein